MHWAAEDLDTPMGPNSKFWLGAHNLCHWLLKRHDIRMKLPFANNNMIISMTTILHAQQKH